MAIEKIDFDQATQQGLNATAELDKIAKTIRNTGAFIQNEFEMQEANDLTIDLRKKAEETHRNYLQDENSFKQVFGDYKNKVLENIRNNRVKKAVLAEFEDREFYYSGKYFDINQKKITETEIVNIAKLAESNQQIAEQKYLEGDYEGAEKILNSTNERIMVSSVLGEAQKYELEQKNKQFKTNLINRAVETKTIKFLEDNIKFDNFTFKQMEGKTVEEIVAASGIDIGKVATEMGFEYNGKGDYYINKNGDILTKDQLLSTSQSLMPKFKQTLIKKEQEYRENQKLNEENINYMIEGIANGKIYTTQQLDMVVQQTNQYGDPETQKIAKVLPQLNNLHTMTNTEEVMNYAKSQFPKSLAMQGIITNIYTANKQKEMTEPADYYLSSGLAKSRIDFSSVDGLATTLKGRSEEIKGLRKQRNVLGDASQIITKEEAKVMVETFRSMSANERVRFLKSLNGKELIGIIRQGSEIDANLFKTSGVYVEMNENGVAENSVNNLMKYELDGQVLDKKGYNTEYQKDVDIQVRKIIETREFPSAEYKNMVAEQLKNQFYGKKSSKGILVVEDNIMAEEDIDMVKEIFETQYGKSVEVESAADNKPTGIFVAATGEKEKISIENFKNFDKLEDDFFQGVNLPYNDKTLPAGENITFHTIRDNPQNFKFEQYKTFDENGKPVVYHAVKTLNGQYIAGDDGRPYLIDFTKDQNILTKSKQQLLKEAGVNNFFFSKSLGIDYTNDQMIELTNKEIERLSKLEQSPQVKQMIESLKDNKLRLARTLMREKRQKEGVNITLSEALSLSYKQAAKDTSQNTFDTTTLISQGIEALPYALGQKQTEQDKQIQEKTNKDIEYLQNKK